MPLTLSSRRFPCPQYRGVRTRDTMQVMVRLGNTMVTVHLYSGSTHSFMLETAATCTGLSFIPRTDLAVKVASGDRVRCPGVVCDAVFSVVNESFRADVCVTFGQLRHGAWHRLVGHIGSDCTGL